LPDFCASFYFENSGPTTITKNHSACKNLTFIGVHMLLSLFSTRFTSLDRNDSNRAPDVYAKVAAFEQRRMHKHLANSPPALDRGARALDFHFTP